MAPLYVPTQCGYDSLPFQFADVNRKKLYYQYFEGARSFFILFGLYVGLFLQRANAGIKLLNPHTVVHDGIDEHGHDKRDDGKIEPTVIDGVHEKQNAVNDDDADGENAEKLLHWVLLLFCFKPYNSTLGPTIQAQNTQIVCAEQFSA